MKRVLISAALAFSLIGGAAKAEDEACQKVRFADVGWTDIQVTTGVAQVLLEAVGYEPVVNTLAVPVTYASLKSKDLDVFLGNWMPSMTADIAPYLEDKSVESISVNLDDAGYGLVV
ncbi:glycine betaine ABC transporter substrate-binding protein, partial [Methyloceanibacter sp.]|uniref:glycine betaine ABC transporter substrate-binding protein n=1 Tax=Methyloceanibacter sp. TaxID=1965321 RepID=UPI00351B1E73